MCETCNEIEETCCCGKVNVGFTKEDFVVEKLGCLLNEIWAMLKAEEICVYSSDAKTKLANIKATQALLWELYNNVK